MLHARWLRLNSAMMDYPSIWIFTVFSDEMVLEDINYSICAAREQYRYYR